LFSFGRVRYRGLRCVVGVPGRAFGLAWGRSQRFFFSNLPQTSERQSPRGPKGPAQTAGPVSGPWAGGPGPRPGPVSLGRLGPGRGPAQFSAGRPSFRASGRGPKAPPPPPTCGAARAAAALQIQAGCLGEIVRQTKGSMLCPRIWLQEPTPKSTVWRGSQNSEWGPAAAVCFSRELQQPENPTLAFFKAEKPSLDVRTKFGGIDAKKSYKNWGRLGVCSTKWAPARQIFFLWNTRKISGAFPREQPAPKNRISKQAAQLTPGCSVGSWRGCVLCVVTQTCHSSATQQPPHLPLAGGEFPVTLK
jgi:hypothetical protein